METELLCQIYPYYRLLLKNYLQQKAKRDFYEEVFTSRKLKRKEYQQYIRFYVDTNHTINSLVVEMQQYETHTLVW